MTNRLQRWIKVLRWKRIHKGSRRDVTMDTWNGLLTCDSKDWLIGKYLYVNGSYEKSSIVETMSFLRTEGLLPHNADLVLDVGANIGMIAIALLKHGFFQRAAAFEPDPNNYRLLVKNVTQNGLDLRIVTFPFGLSSGHDDAILERSPDNFGDHRIRQNAKPGFFKEEDRSTVMVKLRDLDGVISESATLKQEDVALVWLDIQGHEGYFFDGARNLLARSIPVVSEFWPYAILRSGMSRQTYLRIIGDLFTHFYISENGRFRKKGVAELGSLFDSMSAPRAGDQIILIRA